MRYLFAFMMVFLGSGIFAQNDCGKFELTYEEINWIPFQKIKNTESVYGKSLPITIDSEADDTNVFYYPEKIEKVSLNYQETETVQIEKTSYKDSIIYTSNEVKDKEGNITIELSSETVQVVDFTCMVDSTYVIFEDQFYGWPLDLTDKQREYFEYTDYENIGWENVLRLDFKQDTKKCPTKIPQSVQFRSNDGNLEYRILYELREYYEWKEPITRVIGK